MVNINMVTHFLCPLLTYIGYPIYFFKIHTYTLGNQIFTSDNRKCDIK